MTKNDVAGLELAETEHGTRLRLRVRAGARKSGLPGVHAGALKVAVTTAPEKGKANKAVLALLSDALEIPPSAIELLAGHTSPEKTVRLPLTAAKIRDRLRGG